MTVSNEAVNAAAEYLPHSTDCQVRPERDCTCWQYRVDLMRAALEAAAPLIQAQALEDAADKITWTRPEKSPCTEFEACCGTEEFCDAMTSPSVSVVGPDWLRARAAALRGQG